MTASPPPERCRLVLIAPDIADADALSARIGAALSGGDVASLILPQRGMNDADFQRLAERVTPQVQEAGAAVMIAGESRIAARAKADGVHVDGRAALADALDRLEGRMMIGAGGAKTRDDALALGELGPDYVFFGRFGYDTAPEPHHRNLALGEWWAQMIQIPCIVMGGSGVASVATVAATGAEFVALSEAVFGDGIDPRAAVTEANRLLDEVTAPLEPAP